MKQRTRVMQSGDDFIGLNMINLKNNGTDGENDIQLHKVRPQEHFIEAQVQEGDTLQAIALRFHCSLSELKRINHIDKDNEIFARRTIKIPVTPFSVLTEMMPAEPVPSTSAKCGFQNALQNENQSDLKRDKDFSIDCNEIVLNSTLAPAVIPYTDGDSNEVISEDTELLPKSPKDPVAAAVVKELTSHGADLGLKWFHLVCVILALCVVGPIAYLIFVLPKYEHSLHSENNSTIST